MHSIQCVHSLFIKLSFIMLTVYFFFSITNFIDAPLRSNYFLLAGLIVATIGFFLNESFNLINIGSFSIVAGLILGTILFYKMFPEGGEVNYDYTLLFSVIFIAAMGSTEITHLLKTGFYTKLILSLITIGSYFTGLINGSTLYRGEHIRQSLGFSHPNLLGLMVLCLTIEMLYVYFNRINWIYLVIIILVNIGTYLITFSRTSFFCSLLILSLFIIEKYTSILHKSYIKISFLFCIPILFISAVLLPLLYKENSFYHMLNNILSNRLSQGQFFIEEYSIRLFGQPIVETLKVINPKNNWLEGWVLDSAYLRILVQHGLIIYCIIFLFVFFRCFTYVRKGRMIEVAFIIVGLLYGVFERYSYNIFIYTTPLLLFLVPFNQKFFWLKKTVIENPIFRFVKKES